MLQKRCTNSSCRRVFAVKKTEKFGLLVCPYCGKVYAQSRRAKETAAKFAGAEISRENKIKLIKKYRDQTGLGLREAKEEVEKFIDIVDNGNGVKAPLIPQTKLAKINRWEKKKKTVKAKTVKKLNRIYGEMTDGFLNKEVEKLEEKMAAYKNKYYFFAYGNSRKFERYEGDRWGLLDVYFHSYEKIESDAHKLNDKFFETVDKELEDVRKKKDVDFGYFDCLDACVENGWKRIPDDRCPEKKRWTYCRALKAWQYYQNDRKRYYRKSVKNRVGSSIERRFMDGLRDVRSKGFKVGRKKEELLREQNMRRIRKLKRYSL